MKPDWHKFPTCAGWWWLSNLHIMKFFALIPSDSYCEECGPFWGPWTPPPLPTTNLDDAQIIDGYTGKHLDRPQLLHVENGGRCEHCGGPTIDRCERCGAPQCCPQCCKESADAIFEARADGCQAEKPVREDGL